MNKTFIVGTSVHVGMYEDPGQAKTSHPLVISATSFGPTNLPHAYHQVTIEQLRDLLTGYKASNLRAIFKQIAVPNGSVELVLLADIKSSETYEQESSVTGPVLGDFILQIQDAASVICFVDRLVKVLSIDLHRMAAKTLHVGNTALEQ